MKLLQSFAYAFRGIWTCLHLERNFRIHITAVITVLVFSRLYGLSLSQYPPILLAMGLVLGLEAVNTALEQTVDLASKEFSQTAKRAKDAAAAAVLLAALCSVAVAAVTFSDLEKWKMVITYFQSPPMVIGLVVYILIFWIFVFKLNTKEDHI